MMRYHCCPVLLALLLAAGVVGTGPVVEAQQDEPGGEILYSRKDGDRYQVHVMKADGNDSRAVPGQQATSNINPSWSPDGKQLLFRQIRLQEPLGAVYCITDAGGENPVAYDGPGPRSGRMCWSPDGKQIAIGTLEGNGGVYIRDLASGQIRQLPGTTSGAVAPFWSRDGSAVGHTRVGAGGIQNEIAFTRLDGTGSQLLTSSNRPIMASGSALSPDGKRLLYFELGGANTGVRVHHLQLADLVDSIIYENPPVEYSVVPVSTEACWSPDGKWVAVSLPTTRGWGLFRMRPDGTMLKRLTPEGVDCSGASWRAAR